MRWPSFSSWLPLHTDRTRGRRRRRRALWAQCSLLVALLSPLTLRATSVTPPSFTELVGEADLIAQATVTSIEAKWVDSTHGRVIKTFVNFNVEKSLKGTATSPLTLEFLGGTVGTETMHVSGMPSFKVGETEIVFVHGNGVQFCPLVRFSHGRYHVRTDGATRRKYVSRDDDTPVGSVNDVQLPAEDHETAKAFRHSSTALAPEDFEAEVSAEVARHAR